jgi:hypothetical protein
MQGEKLAKGSALEIPAAPGFGLGDSGDRGDEVKVDGDAISADC